jgi:hypothetical protein
MISLWRQETLTVYPRKENRTMGSAGASYCYTLFLVGSELPLYGDKEAGTRDSMNGLSAAVARMRYKVR